MGLSIGTSNVFLDNTLRGSKEYLMRAMGIDVSTKTGVAIIDGEEVTKPVIVFTHEIESPASKGMRRADVIASKIMEYVHHYQPDMIYLEDYAFMFKSSGIVSMEIGTAIRFLLYKDGYDYQNVSNSSIKKFVTGNGKAQKDLMLKEVYKRWGFDTNSDNIADAVGIAMFALAVKDLVQMPRVNLDPVDKFKDSLLAEQAKELAKVTKVIKKVTKTVEKKQLIAKTV